MRDASFLAKLRASGIAITCRDGRLIVEAPQGAVTAEMRAELVKRKPELIATLAGSHENQEDYPLLAGTQTEIAGALAAAYRRYSAIQRVSDDLSSNSGNGELANSPRSSVHGVVP